MKPKLSPEERDALVWTGKAFRSGCPSVAALESLLRFGLVAVDATHDLLLTEDGWKLYREFIAVGSVPIDWNSRVRREALIKRCQQNVAETRLVRSEAAALRAESQRLRNGKSLEALTAR